MQAHIGKTKLGYKELFVKYDVLRTIIHIATHCTCLAVRGTCFYVLGLICTTRSAARALQNLGWESKRESFICVPMAVKDCGVFTVKDCGTEPLWPQNCPALEIPTYSDPRDEVIKHFTNLSCKLTFDKSLNAIKALKAQHPEIFQDHEVQYHICRLMQHYHYQLPPRRFFNQIFDVYWTLDKINSLPSYSIQTWPEDKEGYAYFPPIKESTNWVATSENSRSLRRNSVRGTFGARRASVTKDETKTTPEIPENPERRISPLASSESVKKPAPPAPLRISTQECKPESAARPMSPHKPPPRNLAAQRRGSPDRGGRGGPPLRGRFPQRARGIPPRGRGVPPRPPRPTSGP